MQNVPAEPEGEHFLFAVGVLLGGAVERGFEALDGDGVVAHTENTVELAGDECQTGLAGGARETLLRAAHVASVELNMLHNTSL